MSHLFGKVYITAVMNWPTSHDLYTAGAHVFVIYDCHDCHLLFRGFFYGSSQGLLMGSSLPLVTEDMWNNHYIYIRFNKQWENKGPNQGH